MGLLGRPEAIGEAFHITSDELLTWNQIFEAVADAAGTPLEAVHAPSEWIARFDPEWGGSLLGDKAHSMIFDNSKIRTIAPDFRASIPFRRGVEEIVAWFDADPTHRVVDEAFNTRLDAIVEACRVPRGG